MQNLSKMRQILMLRWKCIKTGNTSRISGLVLIFVRIAAILLSLYLFISSLSFLSDAFRILGGKNIGGLFTRSELLQNPLVGLMIGLLLTVLVQSSSTSTSIIVGLVASGAAPVGTAIPMIMGSNIGTSVTNTFVSFTQVSDREEFKRAFAAATVHDMFNWVSVLLFLPLETATGFLESLTGAMLSGLTNTTAVKNPDFLKVITNPFTKSVVGLNSSILEGWARNDPEYQNETSIIKINCKDHLTKEELEICPNLLAYLGPEGANLGDVWIGVILLIISIVILSSCLIVMVKTLNTLLGDKLKAVINKNINMDIPVRGLGWLTGYIVMLVGAIITVLVQSSSVFTSTLTPLAGAGIVSLDRMYPLTLGSNVGTTTTSLLASMAAGGDHVTQAIQIALVHLCFNISGIVIFYPIPQLRLPIFLAKKLGSITAQYRWFAICYLLVMFILGPLLVFGLSLLGPIALYMTLIPVLFIIVLVIVISFARKYMPTLLPEILKTWDFLPLWMRSLEPYDRAISRLLRTCQFNNGNLPGTVNNDNSDTVVHHDKNTDCYDKNEDSTEKNIESQWP